MITTSVNYRLSNKCFEVVDDELVTDSSQYLDLGTAIRKMMRGELDDVYVPSIRDPRGDKFEIIDAVREAQQQKDKKPVDTPPEQKSSTPPENTPPTPPEPPAEG